jgi:hypothetical protein
MKPAAIVGQHRDPVFIDLCRRTLMQPTQPTPEEEKPAADITDEFTPIPDEDGPHDVPDDKVIEKTLPTSPVKESGPR